MSHRRPHWIGQLALVVTLLMGLPMFGGIAQALPSNDNFADALSVSSNPYTNTTDTSGSTTELEEPQPSCANVGATVWYRLDLTEAALVQAKTFGSKFDTVMAVYTGTSIAGLTEVACNDDDTSVGSQQSRLTASIRNPGTVYIQIGGLAGASGPLKLTVEYEGLVNDNFADAIQLTQAELPYEHLVSSTANATREPGEPYGCAGTDKTVWYRVTSANETNVEASTFGSDYDTVINVYTGASLADLSFVTCNDDYSSLQSKVRFPVEAETTYYLQVGGYYGASGSLIFNIRELIAGSRAETKSYFVGNSTWVSCPGEPGDDTSYGSLGGACFDLDGTEVSVTITITDDVLGIPVGAYWQFRDVYGFSLSDGEFLGPGLCGSGTLAVPRFAATLLIWLDGPLGPVHCDGSSIGAGIQGTISTNYSTLN